MFCYLRYKKYRKECELKINMCCCVCPLKSTCTVFVENLEGLPCKLKENTNEFYKQCKYKQ